MTGSRETLPSSSATSASSPTWRRDRAPRRRRSRGFVGLQTALRSSTLTGLEREVVGVTVSRFNDCAYSLAAHSKFARMQGGDEALVAALVAGEPLADERLETLRSVHARAARRARAHRGRRPVAEEALEVIAQVAYTTLANYAADVSGASIDAAFA